MPKYKFSQFLKAGYCGQEKGIARAVRAGSELGQCCYRLCLWIFSPATNYCEVSHIMQEGVIVVAQVELFQSSKKYGAVQYHYREITLLQL